MKTTQRSRFRDVLLLCAGVITLGAVGGMVLRVAAIARFWDFQVFYESASAALRGVSFYTTYGPEHLPYWYFPWLAWFFIPLALLPFAAAKTIYLAVSLASAGLVVMALGRHFNPHLPLAQQLMILAMSLFMSMLLFIAGQMDFILVGVITALILLLYAHKPFAAGLLFPILLFKPHVLAVFLPFVLLRGGRAFRLTAIGSTIFLGAIAFFVTPSWPTEMLRMVQEYGGRSDNYWNFITLAQLLGSQENWSGTANLPLTVTLLLSGLAVCWRFRRLPLVPFLALTLAASMLCAPRAYTYNLPVLMPPLLWITVNRPIWGTLLWLAAAGTALASNWSTGSYLIVMVVFGLAILEATRMPMKTGTLESA